MRAVRLGVFIACFLSLENITNRLKLPKGKVREK